MADSAGRPMAAAMAGAACTASSAVLMSLAGTSASLTALGRAAFALPVLGLLVVAERRRGAPRLAARSRWLARLSGVFLAGDLILWSHSISEIGAGLATVVANFQIIIVALMAWWLLGERPRRSLVLASPVMFGGLVLVAGLTGARAYGAHPGLGVVYGLASALLFGFFILLLRHATGAGQPGGRPAAVAGPLFESTLGTAAASLVVGLALHDFRLGPAWPALGWLVLLALTAQVLGWMLITVSMPRLPAWLVSAVLLVQPAGSIGLGAAVLGERPSPAQLLGVGLILAGVLIAASGRARAPRPIPEAGPAPERETAVEPVA